MAGIGAAATTVGGVLYVLLSVISARVYDPLGVTPEQVGLGYGAMLIRAAALVLGLAAATGVLIGVALAATWLVARFGRRWWVFVVLFALLAAAAILVGDPFTAAALTASVAVALVVGRRGDRRYAAAAVVATATGVLVGLAAIFWWAERARDHIRDGQDTAGYGPWSAQVVSIRATDASGLPKDRCLLYLGEADGMTVLDDPSREQHTWRAPTAGLLIEVHPDATSTDCE